MSQELLVKIEEIVGAESILINEPMSRHTTYKIGGPVKALIEPDSIEKLVLLVKFFHENNIDFLVFGNGSNLLVEDEGIDKFVIKIERNLSNFRIDGNFVFSESGALLSKLSKSILSKSLTGFEFASGIPGTLGGAVFMNAGAYGGEMKDIVEWVDIIDKSGKIVRLSNDEMKFAYRSSIVKENGLVVLRACLRLKQGNYEEIKGRIAELTRQRVEKQPLELPSCGSVFKRPPGHYAGPLIDAAGMKGHRIGDAQVSVKHSGFIVNLGNATAKDVMSLIELVQSEVLKSSGVTLEREIEFFGK